MVSVYDGQGDLRLAAAVPAGGTCDGKPCWAATGTKGFKFKSKSRVPSGVKALTLQAGGDGAAKIVLKGNGFNFAGPPLPFSPLPITVQLSRAGGPCWQTVSPTADGNTESKLKARGN